MATHFPRLQAHNAYRPFGFEMVGRYLFRLCSIQATDERIREAKKTEERDESTPYETTLQEESDSTIIIHPHHAVIPAAILPTPSLQDPGEAEGTGAQTDSKQPSPC